MAWIQSARGQHAESVAAARRALQLDPVNQARYTELAWVLALGGRHQEALVENRSGTATQPAVARNVPQERLDHRAGGAADAAFAAYREASRIAGASEELLGRLEAVYRAEGLAGYYRGYLKRRGGGGPVSDFSRAQLYVRAGELNQAIESLERAYQKREGALAWVNVEPGFQPLRSDVRFQQIAARVAHQQ
jgi:tetratricopeptide (TPR) repeat protein